MTRPLRWLRDGWAWVKKRPSKTWAWLKDSFRDLFFETWED